MRAAFGVVAVCFVLSACGPDAYEQAKRTQQLAKCGVAASFDQQCSDAYDLIQGAGQGAKEKHLLEVNSYAHNMRDWGKRELRVVPSPSLLQTKDSAYEKARLRAAQSKCKSGTTFDQECVDAFDVIFKPGAGAQQRGLLLQQPAESAK